MLIEDYEGNFVFKGLGNSEGVCHLKIFSQPNKIFIVVLTELTENTGASITNSYEKIVTQVYHKFLAEVPFNKITWIEHYDKNSYEKSDNKHETFDEVNLSYHEGAKKFSSPHWNHIGKNWDSVVKYFQQNI